MIKRSEILEIGRLLKPHGVKGEITVELFGDIDMTALKCVVVDIDGIFVPFFVQSVRPKTSETCLVKFDNLDTDGEVSMLALKPLFALKEDVELSDDSSDEGFYASDLIGFAAMNPEGEMIGKIADVNDDTENTLFIIEKDGGETLLVPVAAEFICDIDSENSIVKLDLPEGLSDL